MNASRKQRQFYLDAPALIDCAPESGWRLRLKYADGVTGKVCLENLLDIGAFKLFRDPRVFATARAHHEEGDPVGCVIWPNAGIRLDSSILYQDLRARGAEPLQPGRDVDFQRFMLRAVEPVPLRQRRRRGGSR